MLLINRLFLAMGWLCIGLSTSALAEESTRLERMAASNTLRVCIWPDYYSITYRNPRSQELSGIDIDNARDLAKALGVQVAFVDSSFAQLVQDVISDRCDLAMFAIGITPQRQQYLRFTQPHLVSDVYAITTRTNRRIQGWADIDQAGSVVVVAKGTLHEPLMKARLKQAQLLVVNTPAAREQEVQAGRADVFMTDYPFSRRMLQQNDWARLVAPTETYHLTPYAWAMKPGDDAFHSRVEKELAAMKADGRLLNNAKRHGLEPIVAR
ncbi:MAG: ABC transporter substrate-binding protein [Hydrogenophaga sp.]|uniref:substrate-binding periplasmic protein n=1 Tax=Hydrogenophaga sp. TaxID=1904254 RepID=UPI00275B3F17|nr:ABC transporter substrate-binding protein [Hydrogenophaga sp.]MDP2418379.1 ABC transporter substrate-binding protein [Hydrogenophaga sp.]MDZ4188712.1 ABC transporter substrate-binding protein [Hydrogenophaga sp.]